MISASDLVTLATATYGQSPLKAGLSGAADPDTALLVVAEGVRARVAAACSARIGWPIPGIWPTGSADPRNPASPLPSGTLYENVWPGDLMAHAIGLLLWRCQGSVESMSQDQRKVGESHEKYFADLEAGRVGLGIMSSTDKGPDYPISAREYTGRALISGIPDRRSLSDTFDTDPFWLGLR